MNACNLIPAARRRRHGEKRLQRRWGVAVGLYGLAVLAASAVLAIGRAPASASATSSSILSLDREQEQIRRDLGTLKTKLVSTRRQLDRVNVIASHPNFSPLLRVLADERHGEVALESCTLRAGALSASPNAIDRRPLEYVVSIAGIAREAKGISAYASALEARHVFDSVTIQEMRERGARSGTSTVGFSLQCTLREGTAPGGTR